MFEKIILVATSLFIGLLVLNLFFRIKLLKLYRKLIEGEVDFPPTMLFNRRKLKEEIVPRYPKYESEILEFSRKLNTSIRIAFFVFVISLIIGYTYLKNR